jgi:hypothetical protein
MPLDHDIFIDAGYRPLALLLPSSRPCRLRQSTSRIRGLSRQCLWRDLERTLQFLASAPIVRRIIQSSSSSQSVRNTVNELHRTANFMPIELSIRG